MRVFGGSAPPDGTPHSAISARVTWTRKDDGTVHHYIEQSTDGGKTWQTFFDGIYVESDRKTKTILD